LRQFPESAIWVSHWRKDADRPCAAASLCLSTWDFIKYKAVFKVEKRKLLLLQAQVVQ